MYSVRQATEKDAVAIRDVATKAWYNIFKYLCCFNS